MLALLLTAALAPISPADPRIVYVGRFDRTDPKAPACQWSASEVRLRVQGRSLVARIDEQGNDRWQVVVDGRPTQVLAPKPGADYYTIDLGSDKAHQVRLVKRTEPFVGTTRFLGFDTPNGRLLRAVRKSRHIQFIGDSITCAYGNEGANQNEKFRPETENAYMSYASIAARSLDADVTILAWSGRKMWPDNTVPEIYDRVLPTQPTPRFDFRGPAPQVVVINLATNDFGPANPDQAKWTGAYESFIRRVWRHYPEAHVYAAIGSMMTDTWPPERKALSTLRGYLSRMATRMNDPRLHVIEFDPQKMEDGIGSDWHPSVRTHEKMAARLTDAIRRDLRW